MVWKILGAVAFVWLVFVVLGWIISGLFWLVTMMMIAAGLYLLYKVATGSDKATRR